MRYLYWALVGFAFWFFSSHELFLKADRYQLSPESRGELSLFNGTFDQSDNLITRDRITDARVVGADYRFLPQPKDWYDDGTTTRMRFEVGKRGTYVAGVSTRPRMIRLESASFNDYLRHEGIRDVLEARQSAGILDRDAREQYAKHVKAVLQVGDSRDTTHRQILNYPVEFVLKNNPYDLTKIGDTLHVQLLQHGQALPNQWVYVGYRQKNATHKRTSTHTHQMRAGGWRTDAEGKLALPITQTRSYAYLTTIWMREDPSDTIDYVSDWATITFELR
ncbi:MAG: DUF4198 domain-containing protein [Bernardetiaceae bacterium]